MLYEHRHKDLGSVPWHPWKNVGIVVRVCNSSTDGANRQITRLPGQAAEESWQALGSLRDPAERWVESN